VLASFVFPDKPMEEVREMVRSLTSTAEFQSEVMYHANRKIIGNSIDEFTYGGLENIDRDRRYVYLSNHRDIMLDASLLQNVLVDNGLDTAEITFGANLMQGELVIDIGKSNKMFKVERPGGSIREFYKASRHLSDYIRHTITEKRQSVWIAQRNGRTKDGLDHTDQGIINMFRMSHDGDKVTSLAELGLLPVSVSYEWEPCDVLKTLELYARSKGPYVKKEGEDLNSILTGILQPKGRVHFQICKPLTEEDMMPFADLLSNDFNKHVASLVDQRVYAAYRLWPNNYIAHDILNSSDAYVAHYTPEQKNAFINHMSQLDEYAPSADLNELKTIFLKIYATPVDSAEAIERQ
jgi:glycerol-3-phosphate O-acyltransferase